MFCCSETTNNPKSTTNNNTNNVHNDDTTTTTFQKNGTTLLIIDAQNDFHPGENSTLPVPNANEDSNRIATLIHNSLKQKQQQEQQRTTNKKKLTIDNIVVTLDNHYKLHIAHPTFWINTKTKQYPNPFTFITSMDIINGIWEPSPKAMKVYDNQKHLVNTSIFQNNVVLKKNGKLDLIQYCIEYTKALEEKGKFKLIIWPEHCIIGSKGNQIVPVIQNAIQSWEGIMNKTIIRITKGEDNLTEMYSALKAEVPISTKTEFNYNLFEMLNSSNKIFIVGQAKSHCVNYTMRDLVEMMEDEERKKVYLLSDCSSLIPGFEEETKKFENDMKALGANVILSSDIEKYV